MSAHLVISPGLRLGSILLAAISLSIGWGIRGNYGHESGAMFPGAITAMTVCLLSGRKDWRERVAYFGFFGALGWGFGGSISYMMVIGYTHSGHAPSQLHGFAGLFLIGFLWAAIGGAGTALPAVLDRRRLTEMFVPLAWLFALWIVMYFALPIVQTTIQGIEGAMSRQESALYWFDSDWLPAVVALAGVLIFDLWDRRFSRAWVLLLLAGGGALLGWAGQELLDRLELTAPLAERLVRYQGDLAKFPREQLVVNWPNFLVNYPQYVGWGIGLIAGVTIYFVRFGQFRRGSALFLYMAVGWLSCFLLLPTLLGLRLTPPRSDDWAGILGVFLGAMLYFVRHRLTAVAWASVVCGTIGGIGFSGATWLKLMLVAPGNPNLVNDPAVVDVWHHWQTANWHSFLEQSYGFINGIGVAVAIGLLAMRVRPLDNTAPRRRWTEIFALVFTLPVLTYMNMIKNVDGWTDASAGPRAALPEMMRSPLLASIELSAGSWFNLFFALASVVMVALLIRHTRKPVALVPESWLGRGQLIYLLLLWSFVLGNFARALPQFAENRLITEGVILVNAVIATWLILTLPGAAVSTPEPTAVNHRRLLLRSLSVAVVVAATLIPLETLSVRQNYGNNHAGHAGDNIRYGPDANWRTKPVLKGDRHR